MFTQNSGWVRTANGAWCPRIALRRHNKTRSVLPASRLNDDRLTWPLQPRNETQRRSAEKRLMKRQEARKRKLAEAGIAYNFDKVEYVSGPTPYAMADQRSTFDSSSHRKKLKARRSHVLHYHCDAPDKLFSHE